jgi:hypothetical protein
MGWDGMAKKGRYDMIWEKGRAGQGTEKGGGSSRMIECV